MGYSNQFFQSFGLKDVKGDLNKFSKKTRVPVDRLKYYNDTNTLPSGYDLKNLIEITGVSEAELMLRMGHIDRKTMELISAKAEDILKSISSVDEIARPEKCEHALAFETDFGKLYEGDCLSVLKDIDSDSIDMVFADPPFNLNKIYPSKINDNLKEENYLIWCEAWIGECVRVLKHGGSLFLWSLPIWNSKLSQYIDKRMTFKHWIAVDMKYNLPVQGRLYPSHYSLLYYVKGKKPATFHPDRLPMLTCPKCFGDLKDYGGYKDKMNPSGVNLTDVWYDIPPVRHAKYKRRKNANELSIKLIDRVIELATNEGDTVLDPFGGSGTTYVIAEIKRRRWIGSEIGPVNEIVDRFKRIDEERNFIKDARSDLNALFSKKVKKQREKRNLWTCESIRNKKNIRS